MKSFIFERFFSLAIFASYTPEDASGAAFGEGKMARMAWTEKKIERMHAEGRGQGSGADYKPWLQVADLSSQGRSRRVWSPKTGRTHHLFSDVEHHLFLVCEWDQKVVDIREQYPLSRAHTQTVAQRLGVGHPVYPGTSVPTVMTADFLLTVIVDGKKSLLALNAKRQEEAEDGRSLEKLEIQRECFEDHGIAHQLIYHSKIPEQKVTNIGWIRGALLKPEEPEPHPGYFADLCVQMDAQLSAASDALLGMPLNEYCARFDAHYGVLAGTGLRVARMLMAERSLMPDLSLPDLAYAPVAAFMVTGRAGGLRVVGGSGAF